MGFTQSRTQRHMGGVRGSDGSWDRSIAPCVVWWRGATQAYQQQDQQRRRQYLTASIRGGRRRLSHRDPTVLRPVVIPPRGVRGFPRRRHHRTKRQRPRRRPRGRRPRFPRGFRPRGVGVGFVGVLGAGAAAAHGHTIELEAVGEHREHGDAAQLGILRERVACPPEGDETTRQWWCEEQQESERQRWGSGVMSVKE